MTMELRAHLELSAVELSASFQVAQLILNWTANAVHVTLSSKAPEQTEWLMTQRILRPRVVERDLAELADYYGRKNPATGLRFLSAALSWV